ncbi:hypothetical protein BG000_006927 [Podila horticola]|nr:hypothetical protein BG000_006927 [Podila horticola]
MIKSIVTLALLASSVYAGATPATAPTAPAPAPAGGAPTPLEHISFTQPVGDGISYEAGTNQTFSWTMSCVLPSSKLFSATPTAVEVDFMDSNNIDNAFYVKKVGTIDCSKAVGNLVWTVPADTKPGVYALQLLLTPNNAYSGRFNVTAPGSGSTQGPNSNGGTTTQPSPNGGAVTTASAAAGSAVPAVVATVLAGGAVLAMFL